MRRSQQHRVGELQGLDELLKASSFVAEWLTGVATLVGTSYCTSPVYRSFFTPVAAQEGLARHAMREAKIRLAAAAATIKQPSGSLGQRSVRDSQPSTGSSATFRSKTPQPHSTARLASQHSLSMTRLRTFDELRHPHSLS